MDLLGAIILLSTAIFVVPIFKKFGLSNILGYLVAGIAIGQMNFFSDPQSIVHFAEFGVIMFLFIIGLEMNPKTLWSLKQQIFGLGLFQVALATVALTSFGYYVLGFNIELAFVAASSFVLSSTALIMQLLAEKNLTQTQTGKKIVSILLFEDLSIVPFLAVISIFASKNNVAINMDSVFLAIIGLTLLVVIGKFILNPIFRIVSKTQVKELMTATALLIVLGAAYLAEWSGLSMPMGAFVAGVLLSESHFKHQVEHDIEPFKGLLLGLFFIGIGMSLNLTLVSQEWLKVLMIVVCYMGIKASVVFTVAKVTKEKTNQAIQRALTMAQGGEFAFVLLSTAFSLHLIDSQSNALLTSAVIISIFITPLLLQLLRFLPAEVDEQLLKENKDVESNVLVVGFGRFGQVATQALLAKKYKVTIVEKDPDMIKAASRFGFNVYYGDGSDINILRSCGLDESNAVLLCFNSSKKVLKVAKAIKKRNPMIKVLARSFDRKNSIELVKSQIDFQIKETFESALLLSKETLRVLQVDEFEIDSIIKKIRQLDYDRFQEELTVDGNTLDLAEKYHLKNHTWLPEPLIEPIIHSEEVKEIKDLALDSKTQEIIEDVEEDVKILPKEEPSKVVMTTVTKETV